MPQGRLFATILAAAALSAGCADLSRSEPIRVAKDLPAPAAPEEVGAEPNLVQRGLKHGARNPMAGALKTTVQRGGGDAAPKSGG
jgi:hypothetical protein